MPNLINLRCPRQAGISKSSPDVHKLSRVSTSSPLWRRMEHLVEHAYIARVDEPQFCPNFSVSTTTPPSLVEILASSRAADSGNGVLTEASSQHDDTVCDATAIEQSTFPEINQQRDRHFSTAGYGSGAPVAIQQLAESTISSPGFVGSGFGLLSSIIPFNVLAPGHISHDGTRTWHPTPFIFPEAQIPSLISTDSGSVTHVWREDSIAVDDHNRYDFANFIRKWRALKSHTPIGNVDMKDAVTASQARSSLDFGNHGAECDIQGLDWRSMGLDREEALQGRQLLHPARHDRLSLVEERRERCPSIESSEDMYHFRAYAPHYRAQPSHSQLRNVVVCAGRSNILYGSGTEVKRTSLACPLEQDTVIDLSPSATAPVGVRVTCLATLDACGQEIVLAGGFNGEYALSNLSLECSDPTQGYVSHAYNGVVTHISTGIDRRSGRLEAVFSCNDQSLRILDIGTSRFTSFQPFDHPINCSAQSSDSRLRLVVGDCRDALLVDADRGETQATLQAHTDNIFACAWAPGGRHVATAAEDGKIVVWDPRSWKNPLHVRFAQMSCARSLHFTEDGLLLAAEDDDVVCIYEPQHFRLQQSIRFFGAIAGMNLIDGGDEIVIGNADPTVGGLMSFQRDRGGFRFDNDIDVQNLGFRHTQHSRFRHTDFDILP